MKRILSLIALLALVSALGMPVVHAEDAASDSTASSGTTDTPTPTPTPDNTTPPTSDGVYVVGYTVTDTAGGEITTVDVGDHVNVVLQVVDHSSARYAVRPEDITARISSSVFQYTGIGEIGQLFDNNDDPNTERLKRVRNGQATEEEKAANAYYNYYSYVLLFRDVIYNGGGNTLPINLTYLDTTKPMQQFSVSIGQCVDKDQTTSPNLLVRSSSYGDGPVVAGEEFTLSLGVYATAGNEDLSDVIVSLTMPENVSLASGSLSNYIGSLSPESIREVTFPVLPSSGFTGTVADITVNLTGIGAISGKTVTGTTSISIPISQPDRFEVGQLQVPSSVVLGETASVSLSYVNKGKNPISNLEARLSGTNLGAGGYQYLGNLNAGTEGSVDFDLTPDAAGAVTGTITLSYEDASGEARTITKDFSTTVEEMMYDPSITDPTIDEMQPQTTGMPVWGWVLIVACGAVVVVVVVVVIKRKKKKKAMALAALEAEDSDEDL
ncbi:hypothetical protein [uncultured Subdoligranulum sp.]|uniref:hypothetical protein n=1 Tax=uncultured Subdoligranulum sp. TaxID=512298 RepID=UPI0026260339|nr:hypothetical protein [uncultured Subdoligranulum sp.]